eukprot:CAMPEP_0183338416 /NCGR_PEP_ID=MMETSP0164_2-20130417/5719_1 /TAXON_ID=221442 /ORGANISM="Coccolithus pelagicus ssp braarudi, Strain PLY182g" /LENGTH=418 /DNA_ID=CAMNT_0025508267 /DNA_START=677 /DNA_END=1931 /DNA_ORIENTATION=-
MGLESRNEGTPSKKSRRGAYPRGASERWSHEHDAMRGGYAMLLISPLLIVSKATDPAIEGARRCAQSNTVIVTVVSTSYIPSVVAMAEGVSKAGYLCVVVQPSHPSPLLSHQLLFALPPIPDVLPEPGWCDKANVGMPTAKYGWRRSHLHRTHLWRVVASLQLNFLALDCDWRMRFDPVPFLRTMTADGGATYDVVAMYHDWRPYYQLNIGAMWVRWSPLSEMLIERTWNRTFSAWDQAVFNEELYFNPLFNSLRCCRNRCVDRHEYTLLVHSPVFKVDKKGEHWNATAQAERRAVEGENRCSNGSPPTLDAPNGTRYRWGGPRKWKLHTTANEWNRYMQFSSQDREWGAGKCLAFCPEAPGWCSDAAGRKAVSSQTNLPLYPTAHSETVRHEKRKPSTAHGHAKKGAGSAGSAANNE